MFTIYTKNNQLQFISNTWQQKLRNREMTKNNYRATGNIKKARAFVRMVQNMKSNYPNKMVLNSEHVIYSRDSLLGPLIPFAYAYIS